MSLPSAAKSLYLKAAMRVPALRKARKLQWAHLAKRAERASEGVAVDPECVFFEAFGGRSYACSPKAIFEQMCADARFDGWRFFWSFAPQIAADAETLPELVRQRAQVVAHESDGYYRALAQAGYWIQNNRVPEYLEPREGQVYVQCWHGTPLKRLGFDVPQKSSGGALNSAAELAQRYKIDADKWSYLVSPSRYTSERLCSAFGVEPGRRAGLVLETGYPRNDEIARTLAYPDADKRIAAIRRGLDIPEDKKVLLYAPTYREDSYDADEGYTFALPLDLGLLQRELGDDWVVLLRLHYYVANRTDLSPWKGFAFDVSGRGDVNELYCASDMLCTDYSSVFFDYANTARPILFFWPDFHHYADELHGLYLEPDELPGPKCATSEEVAAELAGIGTWEERYGAAYARFRERFCPLDDGHASERVIERVFGRA